MSDTTLIAVLFVASAPIALMPALVGLIARHDQRVLILIANLALWGIGYVSVKSFVTSTSGAFLPVPSPCCAGRGCSPTSSVRGALQVRAHEANPRLRTPPATSAHGRAHPSRQARGGSLALPGLWVVASRLADQLSVIRQLCASGAP